jgi:ketosteroid isomerase-like protein
MKKTLLLVALAGLLLGADAPKENPAIKEVEKAINELNTAYEKRDADAIKRLTTPEHVSVTPYYGGPFTRDEQIKTLSELKLKEYTSGDIKVAMLSADVALITYPLTMKGTFKGKELAAKSFASAVWVKRAGKWQEAYYQETAAGN